MIKKILLLLILMLPLYMSAAELPLSADVENSDLPIEIWQTIIKNRTRNLILSDAVHPGYYARFVVNKALYDIALENYAYNLAEKMTEILSEAMTLVIGLQIQENSFAEQLLLKLETYLDTMRSENPDIAIEKINKLIEKKIIELLEEQIKGFQKILNSVGRLIIQEIIKGSSFRLIAANAELFFSNSLKDILLALDQYLTSKNNSTVVSFIAQLSAIDCSIESPLFSYTLNQLFFKFFYDLFKLGESLQAQRYALRQSIVQSLIISRNHFKQPINSTKQHYAMFFLMYLIEISSMDDFILFINQQVPNKCLTSNMLIALILADFKQQYGINIYQDLTENTFFDFEQKLKELLLNDPALITRGYTAEQIDDALANLKTYRGEDLFALLKDFFLLSDSHIERAKLITAITMMA